MVTVGVIEGAMVGENVVGESVGEEDKTGASVGKEVGSEVGVVGAAVVGDTVVGDSVGPSVGDRVLRLQVPTLPFGVLPTPAWNQQDADCLCLHANLLYRLQGSAAVVGAFEGSGVGCFVGLLVAVAVGEDVGASVGDVGAVVGAIVGDVGATVGVAVCWHTFRASSQTHSTFLRHALWCLWWLQM